MSERECLCRWLASTQISVTQRVSMGLILMPPACRWKCAFVMMQTIVRHRVSLALI